MSTFVLIHGGCHGAWCWYKVIPLLEKHGHTVIAPDLPSHGRDKTPVSAVTLQAYVDTVGAILDAQREPVVLVGHSMGGGIITQTAEYRPDKIKTLVYLTALLPANGESMGQVLRRNTASVLASDFVPTADRSASMVREEVLSNVFYGDCSAEDVALAKLLLTPQATAPLKTPLQTSAANFGRIPRVFIECLRDQAHSLSFQRSVYTTFPGQQVISMDTSHSPFFSAPGELAAHLAAL
ncbi:MAG: alpha/beta fold hydrolase [Deltaproteobacteria bacterium]|nr:alpha/beta fold hydrolase [Deltaproteobacteria bacterium]